MNLRTCGPLAALLAALTLGGCPVRPTMIDPPDTGVANAAAANNPGTVADAPSDGSDRPLPAPPADDDGNTNAPGSDGSATAPAPGDNGGADSSPGGDGSTAAPGNGTPVVDDGGDAGSGPTGSATLSGAFGGTIPRVDQQSIDGGNSWFTFNKTATIALEFDAAGKPLAVLVPGFTGIPDLSFAVRDVGDEDSLSGSSVSLSSYTVTVRVTRAVYAPTSAEIDLQITVEGQGGSLTLTGSGTQQIRITLNADGTLSYSSSTRYDGTQQSGTITIQTAEIIDDQGTLSPQ